MPLTRFKQARTLMGSTLCLTLVDTIVVPGFDNTRVKSWIALKQFATETTTATVWQSVASIECMDSSPIQLREHGWHVAESVTIALGKPGALESVPSISQTRIRSRPEHRGVALTECDLASDSFVSRAVTELHENMGMLHQAIENLLVDESLGRSP